MPQPIPNPSNEAKPAIIVRAGLDFFGGAPGGLWDENSPLPPGVRYIELAEVYVNLASAYIDYPAPQNVYFFGLGDNCLPLDSMGNIRRNAKPSGVDVSGYNLITLDHLPSATAVAASLAAIYSDDSMWTGEVADPVNWQDDWWDALFIDREAMAAYLEAHPACRINV